MWLGDKRPKYIDFKKSTISADTYFRDEFLRNGRALMHVVKGISCVLFSLGSDDLVLDSVS